MPLLVLKATNLEEIDFWEIEFIKNLPNKSLQNSQKSIKIHKKSPPTVSYTKWANKFLLK